MNTEKFILWPLLELLFIEIENPLCTVVIKKLSLLYEKIMVIEKFNKSRRNIDFMRIL